MRILCLGNNTEDTDIKCQQKATQYNIPYVGFIDEIPHGSGCYHSSFYDVGYAKLKDMINAMDLVIFVDQRIESYPDTFGFYKTLELVKETTVNSIIENTKYKEKFLYEELKENDSLCILPWIMKTSLHENAPCCYILDSSLQMNPNQQGTGYLEDMTSLKKKMLDGIKSNACAYCYNLEKNNFSSPRIERTRELSYKHNIILLKDLTDIKDPFLYEITPSNECNLMCRMCTPTSSSLILTEHMKHNTYGKEWKIETEQPQYKDVDIATAKRIWIAGGEPLIMQSTKDFLRKLLAADRSDVELHFNTNGTAFTDDIKELIKKFKTVDFTFSVDAVNDVNKYIRWPVNWQKFQKNLDYAINNRHYVMFGVTLSIYNISRLYDLLKWIDDHYSQCRMTINLYLPSDGFLSPYVRPDADVILTQMTKIKELNIYHDRQDVREIVDGFIDHFSKNYQLNLEKLEKFFEFNDRLDNIRGSKLIDYIPELEACRKYITKQI